MDIKQIIQKKEQGKSFTKEEIFYFVNGYTLGIITDDDMTLLLKAICNKGMDDIETSYMTTAMINSGDTIDLSSIPGVKVDKHSTGGVGDKTTLVVAPLAAACGVKVAKLSGRGLGHTGGTIDKLDSIKGFRSDLTEEEFVRQVKEIGVVDASQTKDIVPADKKIYALRDVTGTTNSIPLIASSIMSKKIASGADKIVLDVKTGSGALIKDFEGTVKLAELMVEIGKKHKKETIAVISDMNQVLGKSIGNGLEVIEAIEILEGNGEKDITEFCITLAGYMVSLGKNISLEEAKKEVEKALKSKKGLYKLKDMITYQGGNIEDIEVSRNTFDVYSTKEGYIYDIDEVKLALECQNMGAGRKKKTDAIKYGVGLICHKKIGDYLKEGEKIATVYYDTKKANEKKIQSAFKVSNIKTEKLPIIYGVIK